MAHNVDSMMYVGARPWHGLGKELANVATAEEAILAAGLDWVVEPRSVFVATGPGSYSEIPGKRAITRVDTGHVFNVMSDGYTPVQNREAFGFFDSVVGKGQAIYHTAGSLGAGERVWMLAKLPGELRIEGTDDVTEKFLLLSNSHDGTSALRMFFTPVRVVCQNTLNLAMSGRGKGEGISVRHTANVMKNVQEAQRALGLAVKFYDTLGNTMNELANKAISRETLREYFNAIVPNNADADRNTRTENIRRSMEQNFLYGKGNHLPGIKGTWWAALNGVTEYVDHDRSARGTGIDKVSNRLESQWFGSGAKLKAEAWDTALDMAGVAVAAN
jgi:phage/plasmid-like protein (TIGR03299 family)